jgi:hypothetical protein
MRRPVQHQHCMGRMRWMIDESIAYCSSHQQIIQEKRALDRGGWHGGGGGGGDRGHRQRYMGMHVSVLRAVATATAAAAAAAVLGLELDLPVLLPPLDGLDAPVHGTQIPPIVGASGIGSSSSSTVVITVSMSMSMSIDGHLWTSTPQSLRHRRQHEHCQHQQCRQQHCQRRQWSKETRPVGPIVLGVGVGVALLLWVLWVLWVRWMSYWSWSARWTRWMHLLVVITLRHCGLQTTLAYSIWSKDLQS